MRTRYSKPLYFVTGQSDLHHQFPVRSFTLSFRSVRLFLCRKRFLSNQNVSVNVRNHSSEDPQHSHGDPMTLPFCLSFDEHILAQYLANGAEKFQPRKARTDPALNKPLYICPHSD
jgi:hypothetical protein